MSKRILRGRLAARRDEGDADVGRKSTTAIASAIGVGDFGACRRIQRVLGDDRDAVVASATRRRMAAAAGTTGGEHGFKYGLLYARERAIAADSLRAARNLR